MTAYDGLSATTPSVLRAGATHHVREHGYALPFDSACQVAESHRVRLTPNKLLHVALNVERAVRVRHRGGRYTWPSQTVLHERNTLGHRMADRAVVEWASSRHDAGADGAERQHQRVRRRRLARRGPAHERRLALHGAHAVQGHRPSRPDAIMIAEAIEGAGGVLNAYTSKELTCYWNQVPFDKLPWRWTCSADMCQNSLLEPGGDRPRAHGGAAGDPPHVRPAGRLGVGAAVRATFGDQPIGWPIAGTLETVEAMNREDFVEHMRRTTCPRTRCSASPATRHTRGDAHGRAALRDDAGPRRRRPPPPRSTSSTASAWSSRSGRSRSATWASRCTRCRASDPDRYALTVLNTILGRGMSVAAVQGSARTARPRLLGRIRASSATATSAR